jgi:hypothetical protein
VNQISGERENRAVAPPIEQPRANLIPKRHQRRESGGIALLRRSPESFRLKGIANISLKLLTVLVQDEGRTAPNVATMLILIIGDA